MSQRSQLATGLRLALSRPAALLWTYVCNLGLAFLFSMGLHTQLAGVADHSLAAARLTSAFDLASLVELSDRISRDVPSTGINSYLGIPLYLFASFLLVPGALAAYQSPTRLSLEDLVRTGLSFFWRFIRIALLTLFVSVVVLAPLLLLHSAVARHIDETTVGLTAILLRLPTLLLVVFAASVLRLFFDLVEVYTVQLNSHRRSEGRPDRRVHRALVPAFQLLRTTFLRTWCTFVLLALLGAAAFALTARVAAHTLAQPRVWPLFLLTQSGIFLLLFTRFWQRAAQTILIEDNPMPRPATYLTEAESISPDPQRHPPLDPQPDPEPIAPSLSEPDPAVFHHVVAPPPAGPPSA